MNTQISVDQQQISIPDEIRVKWGTLLDTIVELIQVPVALIAVAKSSHLSLWLYSESTSSLDKLKGRERSVDLYYRRVITTKCELLVANALEEMQWKNSQAVKAGMISCLGLPLFWPDGTIFGALCVLDTRENHYEGNSRRIIEQSKEHIETNLALLYENKKLESLLESLGDIKERYYPDIWADAIVTSDNRDNITFWNREAESLFGYTSSEVFGKPVSLLIAEPFLKTYHNMRQLISAENRNANRQVIEVAGIRKDGIEFPMKLTYTHWKKDNTSSFITVIHPTTERKRLGEMLHIRNRELNALNTIAQSLSQSLKLEEVLHRGLNTIVDTLGLTAGAIYLIDESTGELSLAATQGINEDLKEVAKEVLPEATDIQPVNKVTGITPDDIPEGSPHGQPTNLKLGQYVLTLPLVSRGNTIGSAILISPSEFNDEQVQLLQTANNYLAAAIDNARLFEKTERMSITDGLTGLYNQRHFHQVLETEINRLLRYGGSLSLVMLDLDGFKEFNDRYGHVDGDKVLKSFAQTLGVALRKTDFAFRYGGDEFAIILPLTTAKKAKVLLDRFRKKWAKKFPGLKINAHTPLEFSAGIAEFPQNAETAELLVSLADAALYESKRKREDKSTLVSEMADAPSDTQG